LIKAFQVSTDVDLATFVELLRRQGVNPHGTEEGLEQAVWAANEAEASLIRLVYKRYQRGELQALMPEVEAGTPGLVWLESLLRYPLTIGLIVINVILFPVGMGFSETSVGDVFRLLMFQNLQEIGGDYYFVALSESLAAGEWWRLLTPMFVHFSWLHIVFNLLWVWEIGRRVETINGTLALLAVVFISSCAANVTQYLMSGPGLFGGMSGVVFGLLGHSLVWSRMVPARDSGLSSGIYIFMLVYLVVGFTGAIDLLGLGSLANGAHLGGLLGGLATGAIAGFAGRRRTPAR